MIYCIPVSYSLVTTSKNPINSPETLSKSINRQYQDKHSYFCMFSKYQSNFKVVSAHVQVSVPLHEGNICKAVLASVLCSTAIGEKHLTLDLILFFEVGICDVHECADSCCILLGVVRDAEDGFRVGLCFALLVHSIHEGHYRMNDDLRLRPVV